MVNIRRSTQPSWPMSVLPIGTAVSPTAAPIAVKIDDSHHGGVGVSVSAYPAENPASA
jgi:hypothetical protein